MGDTIKYPLFTWGEDLEGFEKLTTKYLIFQLSASASAGMQSEDACIALFSSKTIASMFARENPSFMPASPTGVVLHSAEQLASLLKKLKTHNPKLAWVAIDRVFFDNQFDQGLHCLESILSALEQKPDDLA